MFKKVGKKCQSIHQERERLVKIFNENAMLNYGAAVAGAVTGFTARFIYERYFSQAAKQCKGKSGKDRDVCLANAHIGANMEAVKALKSRMSGCSHESNPDKCRQQFIDRIESHTNKANKFKEILRKYY